MGSGSDMAGWWNSRSIAEQTAWAENAEGRGPITLRMVDSVDPRNRGPVGSDAWIAERVTVGASDAARSMWVMNDMFQTFVRRRCAG